MYVNFTRNFFQYIIDTLKDKKNYSVKKMQKLGKLTSLYDIEQKQRFLKFVKKSKGI